LLQTAKDSSMIIYCWGDFKNIDFRARQVMKNCPRGFCFGKNKSGSPWHPLAMMYGGIKISDSKLIPFN